MRWRDNKLTNIRSIRQIPFRRPKWEHNGLYTGGLGLAMIIIIIILYIKLKQFPHKFPIGIWAFDNKRIIIIGNVYAIDNKQIPIACLSLVGLCDIDQFAQCPC